jgi:twitching motility protein PilI
VEHTQGTDWNSLRDRPFALLQAMESRLRVARGDTGSAGAKTWSGLAFRLGERWLLAPREEVREVAALPRLTRVPGAKTWLLGVANVRGTLMPVTDLASLLGLPRADDARQQRLLVLEADGAGAGFLVDEVAGQRQFAPGDQRHELLDQAGSLRPWMLGGFRRDGQDWLVLSLRRVARSDEFAHAGA